MKRTKIITLILLLGILLAGPVMLGGCEQYDPQVLQQYVEQADQIELRINELEALIEPAVQDLAAGNVINEADAEKVQKAIAEINELKPQLASLKTAIKEIEYTGDKWIDTIATGKAINSAIEYPYKSVVGLVLSLAGAVVVAFKKNSKLQTVTTKAEEAEASLCELVDGVEMIKKAKPEDKEIIASAMNDAQTFPTKKKVTAIKKELKG